MKVEYFQSLFTEEYKKMFTRRRHTHDLIIRVYAAYFTIALGITAAVGYVFDQDFKIAFQLLVMGLVLGQLFEWGIINLVIGRDLYRKREKILYTLLLHLARRDRVDFGACRLIITYNRSSRTNLYNQSSLIKQIKTWHKEDKAMIRNGTISLMRYNLTEKIFVKLFHWSFVRWSGLFMIFRISIYLANIFFSFLILQQVGPDFLPGLAQILPDSHFIPLVCIAALQRVFAYTYRRIYLAERSVNDKPNVIK